MCDPKILQAAIEEYLQEEEKLFGGLSTGDQTWYKESVENNTSAPNQSTVEPTMSTKSNTETNSETNANANEKAEANQENTMKEKAQAAAQATKGFFGNLWDNHGKKIMFVAGIVTGAGAAVGYDAYANRETTSTGGSEQV